MLHYLNTQEKTVKDMLAKLAPGYHGQKASLTTATSFRLENYWSDGSKREAKLCNLDTGAAYAPSQATMNPMNMAAHAEFELPVGFALVEHIIFQGKDLGIRITVRPENLTPLLPVATNTLTERQKTILAVVRSFISSYRKEYFQRMEVTQEERDLLCSLGYLTKQGAITPAGKNMCQGITV